LTPNPILKVLSTLCSHEVRYLLMGGQACVFYGGAEFSRDTERSLLSLAASGDETGLEAALELEEQQEREADRAYWTPLKAELEGLRRKSREKSQ
jgi:hypothetical protein